MTTMDIVRPRLRWFVREMDRRLARPKNQAKADWRDPRPEVCTIFTLFDHAKKELEELQLELPLGGDYWRLGLTPEQVERIVNESSDLANMAFMVADRARSERRRRQR